MSVPTRIDVRIPFPSCKTAVPACSALLGTKEDADGQTNPRRKFVLSTNSD